MILILSNFCYNFYRASFGLDLLLEAYKVLHGTAGQLNALMEQNKAVQSMVKAFVNVRMRSYSFHSDRKGRFPDLILFFILYMPL